MSRILLVALAVSTLPVDAFWVERSLQGESPVRHQVQHGLSMAPPKSATTSVGFVTAIKANYQRVERERKGLSELQAIVLDPHTQLIHDEGSRSVKVSSGYSRTASLPLVQLAVAGAVATFLADVVIHPLDCIKTLQQSDLGWELGLHNSVGRSAQYLWATSGMAGFYRGFLVYAGSDAVAGAVKFATWEWWKRSVPSGETLFFFVGAGLSFLTSSVLLVPGELVKQQLQMGTYPSFLAAVDSIWQTCGTSGFFVGYHATCFRDVPYTMIELGLYEVIKRFWRGEGPSPGWFEMGAACVTGALAATLTTPMDAIKTKMMASSEEAVTGYWDCIARMVEQHGMESLWCGLEARVSWLVPFVCIYLPLYDTLKRGLLQRNQSLFETEA